MHPLSLARFSVKGAVAMERLQTIAIELKGEELEGGFVLRWTSCFHTSISGAR